MRKLVVYHGPINMAGARNAEVLLSTISPKWTDEITFCICSGGGDVTAGIGLYNFIRLLPIRIDTHCFGLCGSIAATVFLAGKRRTTSRASMFTLHAATFTEGPRKGEVSENTQMISEPFRLDLNWDKTRIDHYFSDATERFIAPSTAKDFGIVQEIEDLEMGLGDGIVNVAIP